MADQHRPDDLAALRAEFAAFRAVQEAEIARLKRRKRLSQRLLPVLLAALLVALIPLATQAATPFVDLTGGPHDGNIEAIYTAGITKGCDSTHYCPIANVTREEMASFLARAAGLGTNPPIANAATAQSAANAGNANTVGGLAASGLVRAGRGVGANRADLPSPRALTITQTFTTPPLPATLQSVVSVEVVAPAPGFVLVTGAVYIQLFASGGSYPYAYGRVRHAATGDASPALVCGSTATNTACSLSPAFVFPVGAGTHTFTLEVVKTASSGTAEAYDGAITALYVPFGATGGSTLSIDAP